jgi:hypothetical protein
MVDCPIDKCGNTVIKEQKAIVKEYISSLMRELSYAKYSHYDDVFNKIKGACEMANKLGLGEFAWRLLDTETKEVLYTMEDFYK